MGKPVVMLDTDSPVKRAFTILADAVADAAQSSLEAHVSMRP